MPAQLFDSELHKHLDQRYQLMSFLVLGMKIYVTSWQILLITISNIDTVIQMSGLGVWMLPGDFVPVFLMKQGVSNHQMMLDTLGEKESSIDDKVG